MEDEFDITEFAQPKKDQLDADDLMDGPITGKVLRVTRGPKDQPVHVHIDGWPHPWKPALTCRKQLLAGWGGRSSLWKGRSVRLYRDPKVNSPDGTRGVGGVRIKAMSHIERPLVLPLRVSRGKKRRHVVEALKTESAPYQWSDDTKAWFVAELATLEIELGDFAEWLVEARESAPPSSRSRKNLETLIGMLSAEGSQGLHAFREWRDAGDATTDTSTPDKEGS